VFNGLAVIGSIQAALPDSQILAGNGMDKFVSWHDSAYRLCYVNPIKTLLPAPMKTARIPLYSLTQRASNGSKLSRAGIPSGQWGRQYFSGVEGSRNRHFGADDVSS
jgi:hypothetical protein